MTFKMHSGSRPKPFYKWGSQRSDMSKHCNYGDNRAQFFDFVIIQAQVFHKSLHAKLSIPVVAAQIFEDNLLTFIFSHVYQLVMLEKLK